MNEKQQRKNGYKMNWIQLLCESRPSENKYDEPIFPENEALGLTAFERDYYTIVSSSYFRRLQKKTQVHVLDTNDFTRTRLTHSMEVAAIAEILGKKIGAQIVQRPGKKELPYNFENHLSMVLRCAGLLHDLGNPPFGHPGEKYIREFFEDRKETLKEGLSDQQWYDLINFEGNANNIRIVTKLGKSSNPNDKGYGMDLTYAVINSLIKYPCNSLVYKDRSEEEGEIKKGKIGFYQAEEWIIKKYVSDGTGTKIEETDATGKKYNKYLKNPIMLIMEAADDIAYATADVEDAVKKRIFTKEEIIGCLNGEVPQDIIDKVKDDDRETGAILHFVRELAMEHVVETFMNNYSDIMNGEYREKDLIVGFECVNNLKDKMADYYEKRDKEAEIKWKTRENVHYIIDKLIECIRKEDGEREFEDWLVLSELKQYIEKNDREVEQHEQYIEKNDREQFEIGDIVLYHKYMAVVDFVTGMTDSYVALFSEKLSSSNYDYKEFKEKWLGNLDKVDSYKEANKVWKCVAKVDDNFWDNHEIEYILKCYRNNNQLYEAFSSVEVIQKLLNKIEDYEEKSLTEEEIADVRNKMNATKQRKEQPAQK